MSDIPFDAETQEDQVIRFIDNYLKSDGIFVIRMVTLQSGVGKCSRICVRRNTFR